MLVGPDYRKHKYKNGLKFHSYLLECNIPWEGAVMKEHFVYRQK